MQYEIISDLTNLMLCCPMTTQVKGYPFEVLIAGDRAGAALADQVKSLDWVAVCKASHKGKISSVELAEVRTKIWLYVKYSGQSTFNLRRKK